MRSSSIKSFAATLTLTLVLSLTPAFTVDARQTQTPQDSIVAVRGGEGDVLDRSYRFVLRIIRRVFTGPVANTTPSIPIPAPTTQG